MIEARIKKCWIKFAPPAPPLVGFEVDRETLDEFNPLLGKDLENYTLVVKKKIKKSRDMHNYMWALCDRIAEKLLMTKEDAYRHAVRCVGLWNDGTFDNDDVPNVIEGWEKNGIGWFCETVFKGSATTILRLYRGASVYNGEQLHRLTSFIVDEARELGIETITDNELEHLKSLWEGKNG